MGHPLLDDMNEEAGNKSIAKALGITVDELEELDYGTLQTNESSEGLIYNYYIEIQKESSSEEVLNKVMSNRSSESNREFVTVYLELEEEADDSYNDDYEGLSNNKALKNNFEPF